jgi:trk system potassium uptake protein TrkA
MYIVINGGGKVGFNLGYLLSNKGYSVAIIEQHPEIIEKLAEELPTSVLLIEGNGCDVKYLEEAGVDRADIFVAVTGSDQDNFVSCKLAKVRFNVKRVLARVNSPENEYTLNALGIETISSTTVISNLIENEMTAGEVFTLHILKKGRLELVEINLTENHCVAANKMISELPLPRNTVLVSIIRGDNILIPKGDTVIETGDRVIAVTSIEEADELRRILAGS